MKLGRGRNEQLACRPDPTGSVQNAQLKALVDSAYTYPVPKFLHQLANEYALPTG
jgi:hypothetical protein